MFLIQLFSKSGNGGTSDLDAGVGRDRQFHSLGQRGIHDSLRSESGHSLHGRQFDFEQIEKFPYQRDIFQLFGLENDSVFTL